MGVCHTQLRALRDGTQAVCALGLHTVCTEAPCHGLCFSEKPVVLRSNAVYGAHWLKQGGGTQGPPASFPPQVAGTLPGSLGTLDDREGTNARQEGVKAWPQVIQPGIEPLPSVLRRKLHDFLL